ncbi:carboxypeptidase regulatory-like domain-containing protein [Pontibacter toksunensis]|uniref:Carboxypeptidase regulatory-like domain-containing protein n=1 Tax=Pontibacter toksunensis TaxID=1332631 RepID=A0ABW6BU03_9BACT
MPKLLLLPLTLLLSFCNGTSHSSQTSETQEKMEQPETQRQATNAAAQGQQAPIEQGITGRVIEKSGNQMPSPDAPPSKGKGVERTVYVYELTNGSQATTTDGVFHTNIQTNLVTQVNTDADGNFAVSLKPGRYSLFTKEEQGLYANLFDGQNNIFPVEVQEGQVTEVEFVINYNASY